MAMQKPTVGPKGKRWLVVGAVTVAAFFASYTWALAQTDIESDVFAGLDGAAQAAAPAAGAGGGCACCGGTQAPPEAQQPKAAEVVDGVQKIDVDVTQGYYNPGTVELQAGIPAEITFSQGSGCTAYVQSQDLGFSEDISGGPKTVKIADPQPGEYGFECGMSMVFGKIVVK